MDTGDYGRGRGGRGGRGVYRGRGGGGRGGAQGGGGQGTFLGQQPAPTYGRGGGQVPRGRGGSAWGARGGQKEGGRRRSARGGRACRRSPRSSLGAPRGGYRGRGGRGGAPAGRFDGQPADLDFVRALRGHSRPVVATALDPSSATLYTGSQDGTVRAWSVDTGAPGPVVEVGGEVDSLLVEGGWLFVGLHTPAPSKAGIIKAFNLATGASATLEGHSGQVLCLAAAGGTLFSGGQDATIRAWAWDAAAATFRLAGALAGHAAPVQALAPAGAFLVSGDWGGDVKVGGRGGFGRVVCMGVGWKAYPPLPFSLPLIRLRPPPLPPQQVWNLATATCVQTLPAAHASVVMGCLTWEGHVVTAGLDGDVRVWAPAAAAAAAAGALLDPTPSYSHPPGGAAAAGFGGVLALAGAADARGGAVLLASHADDGCVRLWELPSFAERGVLGGVTDARALAAAPGGVVAVGDKRAAVKLWRWTTAAVAGP